MSHYALIINVSENDVSGLTPFFLLDVADAHRGAVVDFFCHRNEKATAEVGHTKITLR